MSTSNPSTVDLAKAAAGKKAATLIEPGMLVGIGTGSTASYFIEALIERVQEGLRVRAVATSKHSAELAAKGGIDVLDINDISSIDMTVDGADEITPNNLMIKGGGGAHLREKIIAAMSDQVVIIIDPSKEVEQLGHHPLPVEITPFGYRATVKHIEAAGFSGELRHKKEGSLFLTDGQNYLFDIQFDKPISDPKLIDSTLKKIPGVIETGFFFDLATQVVVGYPDGSAKIRT